MRLDEYVYKKWNLNGRGDIKYCHALWIDTLTTNDDDDDDASTLLSAMNSSVGNITTCRFI